MSTTVFYIAYGLTFLSHSYLYNRKTSLTGIPFQDTKTAAATSLWTILSLA